MEEWKPEEFVLDGSCVFEEPKSTSLQIVGSRMYQATQRVNANKSSIARASAYGNIPGFDWNSDQSRRTEQGLWRTVEVKHRDGEQPTESLSCCVVRESEDGSQYVPNCDAFTVVESICVPSMDYQTNDDFRDTAFGFPITIFQERVASNDGCEVDEAHESMDGLKSELRAPDAMSPCVKSRRCQENKAFNILKRNSYMGTTVTSQPSWQSALAMSGSHSVQDDFALNNAMHGNDGEVFLVSSPEKFAISEFAQLQPSIQNPIIQDSVAMEQSPRTMPLVSNSCLSSMNSEIQKARVHPVRGINFANEAVNAAATEVDRNRRIGNTVDCALRLEPLLMKCAEAIETQDSSAYSFLEQLRRFSRPAEDPMQRIATHFCDALSQRLVMLNGMARAPKRTIHCENLLENHVFSEFCPYSKFVHLTANQALLEALEGADCVHIIDCGIAQGLQWSALLQAMATAPGYKPPSKIRITGIAAPDLGFDPSASLHATGVRLTDFAKLLGLQLEFCPLIERIQNLRPEMLGIRAGECIAFNFLLQLFQHLGDAGETLFKLLRLVRKLQPKVLLLAEHEASINDAEFLKRFSNALVHYWAIFESLDATMTRDSAERAQLENAVFGGEILNIVACEGPERYVRHQTFERWRRIMETADFLCVPPSHYSTSQARLLLWLFCDKFRVVQGSGSLSVGWLDAPLLTVSSWQCASSATLSVEHLD